MTKLTTTLSRRDLTALAGSLAAGALIAREIRPAVAQTDNDPFADLIADHRRVSALLSQLAQADPNQARQLMKQLKLELTAHSVAEENAVYPVLRDVAGDRKEAQEAYEEHSEVKVLLWELEQFPPSDPKWKRSLTSLTRAIEHHVRQEENKDFPAIRMKLNADAAQALAAAIRKEKSHIS